MVGKTKPKVVNWIGVLAQLRRVDEEHQGRLVVVERAAQALPAAMGGEPMPVWHVYVLGARLRLQGDAWREADVAEICLQPLSRLPEVIADAAIVAQAEQDFEAAMAELSYELARCPIDEADFDALAEKAAQVVSGPRRWPVVTVRGDCPR